MQIDEFIKQKGTFLKAQEVKDNPNAKFVITGEAVIVENEFKGNKTQRLHVEGEFNQTEKIFDMSKTNSRIIAEKAGTDTKAWIGKKLSLGLYRTKTSEGKTTDAIEITSVE